MQIHSLFADYVLTLREKAILLGVSWMAVQNGFIYSISPVFSQKKNSELCPFLSFFELLPFECNTLKHYFNKFRFFGNKHRRVS